MSIENEFSAVRYMVKHVRVHRPTLQYVQYTTKAVPA